MFADRTALSFDQRENALTRPFADRLDVSPIRTTRYTNVNAPADLNPVPVAAAGINGGAATLAESLADRLREMIIEGELPPGMRLNERALCDRLGASRTPLREAFRLLAAEHLVELQPNRGAQVVTLSDDDIRESFEVMGALEALAGELACRRVAPEEVAEVKALTFEMLACHARARPAGVLPHQPADPPVHQPRRAQSAC